MGSDAPLHLLLYYLVWRWRHHNHFFYSLVLGRGRLGRYSLAVSAGVYLAGTDSRWYLIKYNCLRRRCQFLWSLLGLDLGHKGTLFRSSINYGMDKQTYCIFLSWSGSTLVDISWFIPKSWGTSCADKPKWIGLVSQRWSIRARPMIWRKLRHATMERWSTP